MARYSASSYSDPDPLPWWLKVLGVLVLGAVGACIRRWVTGGWG